MSVHGDNVSIRCGGGPGGGPIERDPWNCHQGFRDLYYTHEDYKDARFQYLLAHGALIKPDLDNFRLKPPDSQAMAGVVAMGLRVIELRWRLWT